MLLKKANTTTVAYMINNSGGYSVKGVSVTDQRSMDVCLERSIHIQAEHLVEAQNSIAGMKLRVLKDPSD